MLGAAVLPAAEALGASFTAFVPRRQHRRLNSPDAPGRRCSLQVLPDPVLAHHQ
jgi:hypothetical protein